MARQPWPLCRGGVVSWSELTAKMAMKNGDFSVTNMVILPRKKMRCNGGNMGDTSVKVTMYCGIWPIRRITCCLMIFDSFQQQ